MYWHLQFLSLRSYRNRGLVAITLGMCICPYTAQKSYQAGGNCAGSAQLRSMLTVQAQELHPTSSLANCAELSVLSN